MWLAVESKTHRRPPRERDAPPLEREPPDDEREAVLARERE
jgi:hypothetical protein